MRLRLRSLFSSGRYFRNLFMTDSQMLSLLSRNRYFRNLLLTIPSLGGVASFRGSSSRSLGTLRKTRTSVEVGCILGRIVTNHC